MTHLGAILLAIGVTDLLCYGLAGDRLNRRRAVVPPFSLEGTARVVRLVGSATIGSVVVVVIAAVGLDAQAREAVALVADTVVLAGAWGGLRAWVGWANDRDGVSTGAQREPRQAKLAIGVMSALVVINVFAVPAWPDVTSGFLLDYTLLLPGSPRIGHAMFLLGLAAVQVSTFNSIVRLVLSATGTLREEDAEPVGGGRWIGPLERVVLALLVLVNEFTAASLVTTATGVLRQDRVKTAKDYVVLGALTSLLLAIVPALLLRLLF